MKIYENREDLPKNLIAEILFFSSSTCSACPAMADALKKVDVDDVAAVKISVDDDQVTPSSYDVMTLPTIIVLQDGLPVASFNGVVPADRISKALEECLA